MIFDGHVNGSSLNTMAKLSALGIGTRPFFFPLHLQPVFRRAGLFFNVDAPVSENLASKGFYIPSGLALTHSQLERVAEVLLSCLDD